MKRSHVIAAAIVALLVGVFGVFWAFGTPQAPAPMGAGSASEAPAGAVADEPGLGGQLPADEQDAPSAAGGMPLMGGGDPSAIGKEAPPADPNSPLAIQIPGCTCHSDDPKIVEEHAQYRMNQCFGCHSGGPKGE